MAAPGSAQAVLNALILLDTAVNAPPSPSDGPGGVYYYTTNTNSGITIKIGRSIELPGRQQQWETQCWPEAQEWVAFYYQVPFAAKFERILHRYFKLMGVWLGPVPCNYCGRRHIEKFDLELLGGRAEFERVVEHYAAYLGWVVVSGWPQALQGCLLTLQPAGLCLYGVSGMGAKIRGTVERKNRIFRSLFFGDFQLPLHFLTECQEEVSGTATRIVCDFPLLFLERPRESQSSPLNNSNESQKSVIAAAGRDHNSARGKACRSIKASTTSSPLDRTLEEQSLRRARD
ncbi:hypothetical protein DFH07DRAFT_776997 [Mycena maculata]|uniref:GIY-YIG nuclease family protein n=1 Tax=Mycena maculata TaxID=230809 RepID=A0AAD7N444_9AGAR|nr:hypothetical protein DFH07DRAFT_776997 [Mycena maculata]